MKPRTFSPPRGFTLVELLVTITVLAVLAALGTPSFAAWIKNGQVRASADALQNGLRQAQAESLRRSRQVVFSLTDAPSPTELTAQQNGAFWSINTVSLAGSGDTDDAVFVESGVLGTPGSAVAIEGPASICFSSLGRLTANAAPGGGAACSATEAAYTLSLAGADRNLKVLVSIGGQVRMCDPAKTLSSSHPDGCPSAS